MKRKDIIFNLLNKLWNDKNKSVVERVQGSTTADIAESINVSRANVSTILNQLVREGKVIKIKKYPVKYLPKAIFDKFYRQNQNSYLLNNNIISDVNELSNIKNNNIEVADNKIKRDPFTQVIGSDQSLHKAVMQAKAAVVYPPHGLHMLLLGPTGSGKTFFAKTIYEYAKYKHTIKKEAPFIAFNCADYYNNSQLLLSQLFGYAKGAYTGANKDEMGVVERADGGILLLDEIHRLPPEGQEMLFYFIDSGYFSRLGESEKKRKANVLIISATTENPDSTLLNTFLRRIPTIIHIPSFTEKGIREKIDLMKFLFKCEAARINRDLDVNLDVFEALISSNNYGNIGQLKSQIQLICAQAFLNGLNNDKDIIVNSSCLPEEFKVQQIMNKSFNKEGQQLINLVSPHTVFTSGELNENSEDSFEPNIYSDILDKVNLFKKEGYSDSKIQKMILNDLHSHILGFLNQSTETIKIQGLISPEILKLTEKLRLIAIEQLHYDFDQRFIYYIGMHIDTYFKRGQKNNILMEEEVKQIKQRYKDEYDTSLLFKRQIYEAFQVLLPDIEVIYLTMLLSSLKTMSVMTISKVGILIVAHGNSTATSMMNVAVELFGEANIAALDMPLNISPEDMMSSIINKIIQLNQGKGVLLLVDMGSLTQIKNKIENKTSISIRILPFVTTLIVLDAVRKANYFSMDLSSVYNSVLNDFKENLLSSTDNNDSELPKMILSICTTGSGTAERLKTIITNIVNETTRETVQIKTVSALKLKEQLPELLKRQNVIASVGTKNPNLKVPYISLESLVAGNGETVLKSVLQHDRGQVKAVSPKNIVVQDICVDILKSSLIYLNPFLMTNTLISWMKELEIQIKQRLPNSLITKCVVHTCFAFERSLQKETLSYTRTTTNDVNRMLTIVDQTLDRYEKRLKIRLPRDERLYIAELLTNELSVLSS